MFEVRMVHESDVPRFLKLIERLKRDKCAFILEAEQDIKGLMKQITLTKQHIAYFMATQNDENIGAALIVGHLNQTMNHVAHVNIAILSEWREKGFGYELLKSVEGWALENHYHRLEASVADDNRPALLLFGSCGYHVEGIRQSAFLFQSKLQNAFYMAKLLKNELPRSKHHSKSIHISD
ncbi:GNAT family N-acetyltransferase [Sporolactobacillus kofuensis]|uniref:GNAT family N-acetyltransferase n=1 Tax=Sporolactobacillus kofuensis TaxID=269672 RepID=A0ABW1WB58_9BACL|nr:GNAT family N-acetyltransferase [Sporolactobacillus kofuensis]MCO7174594.1 GNAT family N-acetyltransferase [Sporolactobacillus kofuensis]